MTRPGTRAQRAIFAEPPAFHTADFYRGDPHAVYRRLRAEAPVYWHEIPGSGGDGMWILSRWADIRAVSKQPRRFVSSRGVLINDRLQHHNARSASYVPKTETIIHMDPPKHGRIRNLVSRVFTPRRVAELEGWMRELCAERFDALPRGETIDFVNEVAAPLPAITMARILGVPREQWLHFQHCANAMIAVAAGDPDDLESLSRHGPLVGELARDLRERIERYKSDPGNDLLSALVHVQVDGEGFDEDDVVMMALILLGAGNETTRSLVSGACLALLDHPEQRERLIEDPSLVAGAVEEFLRWITPVQSHTRTARHDCQIRGVSIREGDYLVMLYAAANRDEEVWDRAEEFDVTRPADANPHLAFGHGEHFCLGAHLARLEARVISEEFLARFPRFVLAGAPVHLRSTHINGMRSLPVKL